MTTTSTKPTDTLVHPTRRSSRFTWLAVLVVLFAVALGFGAGFLTSQMGQDEPSGLADDATVSLIEDFMAAGTAGDLEALEATTTPDVVLTGMDRDGVIGETEGGAEGILAQMGEPSGLKATSEFMQQGNLVTSTYSESESHGVQTFEITDGKISHVWLVVDYPPGPAD